MTRKSKIITVLTGGLGNQLFQLAFSLCSFPDSKIELNSSLLSPRKNLHSKAEIFSFNLPERVQENQNFIESGLFISKVSGFLLRSGLKYQLMKKRIGFQSLIQIIGIFIFSTKNRNLLIPFVGQGVGFFSKKLFFKSRIILGYFQSYRWASDVKVFRELMSIQPTNPSEELIRLIKDSELEKPLVLHIRLGDYKNEKHFGIPNAEYFNLAINELWDESKFKKIWIFSDEINLAKKLINNIYYEKIRWIQDINNSTAETFEAMRYGQGYIISNSTFSWWAAFLTHSENVQVIAPNPWFAGMESPLELIPPGWQTREAF